MNYCPLNVYTCYNFLSSALRIDDVFNICKKYNYHFFGVTDLNIAYSFGDILSNNKIAADVKGIFGASFIYFFNQKKFKLSCFIENEIGYHNLINIISSNKNIIDNVDFKFSTEGLIGVLECISNDEIKNLLIHHDENELSKTIFSINKLFKKFYLGIEVYNQQDQILTDYLRIFAKNHNYQCVAFNKHLYINKNDAITIDILNAIKNNTKLEYRQKDGPYFFLKENALQTLYSKDEIENTYQIALQCNNFTLNNIQGKLLSFPGIENKKDYIKNYAINKLNNLSLNNKKYIDRLEYELNVIEKMGYLDYFLIVQDYVLFAKKNNILVGPGRGSAAGSLISYLLDITNVDPIKYDLLFERFLNPKRTSMPDIDIDFEDYRRDEIISYIQEKYGYDRTASIITFQTFKAKGCLQDIQRVFNIDSRDIKTISNCLMNIDSFKLAYKKSDKFKDLIKDNYYLEIVKLARKLEGLPRQSGLHAAGIIINDESLINYIPVQKTDNNTLITQFEKPLLEELGFLKMDILGLTNLTIIKDMCNYINIYYNKDFSLNDINLNDKKTLDILNKGLTCGIFQLESSGITKAIKEIKVNSFDDIVSTLALYRPGPMDNIPLFAKNKNEKLTIRYQDARLKPILESTYGIIVYQEQIMQIAQSIAGFDLGKADLFRRAISKKDNDKLSELKDDFINGATKNGIDKYVSEDIFELIHKFANYGFNKSHSVSYAIITYQMAYIKANYPHAFYASILNHFQLNDHRINTITQELNYFGIKIALPSINKSRKYFVIEDNKLIIPFTLIKGLNRDTIDALIDINKNYVDSFTSFIEESLQYKISEESINALINAGAFDEFNLTRKTLRKAMPILQSFFKTISLEGDLTKNERLSLLPIIKNEDEDENLKLDLEYQTLNIILSGSLLERYKSQINSLNINPIKEQILNINKRGNKIAVIIKSIKIIKTKNNQEMAILIGQDDSYLIEIILFASVYKEYTYLLKTNNAIICKGYLKQDDKDSEKYIFIAQNIMALEEDK